MRRDGVLVLANGTLFEGELIGAEREPATGEVVFNTSLSGYQEILTDPSYAGQIITFTYPHIGNYGANPADAESRRPFCRGIVVRDLARRPSNWRSTGDLDGYLQEHGVPGIAGIDTRRLTRHLRDAGSMPGAFGADEATVRAAAATALGTEGVDLVAEVTTTESYTTGDPDAPFHVVAYDYGIKTTILRYLASAGCHVEVVSASTPAADVLARTPDGV
ncbi:MAG: carbamoyl phosphate synthase small subunit, partial [Acidimicrobiia bacterium]